jgi:hypothetical protein
MLPRLVPIEIISLEIMLLGSLGLRVIRLRHIPELNLELVLRLIDVGMQAIV